MGPVITALQQRRSMRRDELVQLLGSGRTPEDIDNELRHYKEQGLIHVDIEGYWHLAHELP